jgi:Ca2+-binding RTX toxin-like protein
MANFTGTTGSDSLTGTTGSDLFDGMAGNDTLQGGAGDDTYLFGRGSGRDLIASTYDTRATRMEILSFKAGVLPSDLQASFVGNNLVLTIAGTADSITVQDFKYSGTPSNPYNPVQQFRFSNGMVWDTVQMVTAALRGTTGADSLVGTNGNDTFAGSAGNDTLVGGGGDDTYSFGRGEGIDYIASAYDTRPTRLETLAFKAGVLPTDIHAYFVNNDLVLAIKGTTDSIAIQDFKYSGTPSNAYNPVQQVRFANGTVWNTTQLVTEALRGATGADSLVGTNGNDTFAGSAGNDTLVGGGGDDTYFFGRNEAKDFIASSYDTRTTRMEILNIKAGVLPTDIEASFVGNHLVLAIKGTADSITVQDFKYGGTPSNPYNPVQQVRFSNGTVWNTAQLVTEALRGTTGADSLVGTNGNDTFSGSAGNDTLVGGGGDDTFYFGRTEGKDLIAQDYDSRITRAETLIFKSGVLPSDIQASLSGNDLVLSIRGTTDAVTVQGFRFAAYGSVQQVRFASGTTWNQSSLRTLVGLPPAAPPAAAATALTSQIDQLVSAMASFTTPAATLTVAAHDPMAALRPMAIAVGG